jgi:hypothetical protein
LAGTGKNFAGKMYHFAARSLQHLKGTAVTLPAQPTTLNIYILITFLYF